MRILFVIIFSFIFFSGISQEKPFDPDSFTSLKAENNLPDDLLKGWLKKYDENLQREILVHNPEMNADELGEFWLSQQKQIERMLQSGKFSFGDPLSVYLNRITDILLKDDPELREEIRVYLFKSPSVNAFSVADGIIGVNTGLLAHAKSEAELAYILAHEISHYTGKHQYERFKQAKALDERGWFSSSINPVKKFDALTHRSKEHELEADALGLELFLKSPYHHAAIDTAFTTLHQSYLSFGRNEVGDDFLAIGGFKIPTVFFREDLVPISREEDYFDETHNHPNIATRRLKIEEKKKAISQDGKQFFVQDEELFYNLRDLARFEMVREKILYGRYGEVLYDIYTIEKKYPDNRFLQISKARALYGLASFMAVNKGSEVNGYSYNIEGPSQQALHILKQFNSEQMISLAIHYIKKLQDKYPKEEVLPLYISNLSRMLLINCDKEVKDFAIENTVLPEFDKSVEDFPSERHYLRAKQMHYNDFHKYLLKEEVESGWLSMQMEEHRKLKDSLIVEKNMPHKERIKRRKELQKQLDEFGTGLNVRDIVLLDPVLVVLNASSDFEKQLEGLNRQEEFISRLNTWVKAEGMNPTFLYLEKMKPEETTLYNQFSALEEWIIEARFYSERKIIPGSLDIRQKIDLPQRYVCRIIGILDDDDSDYYYFGLYDLKKGKVVYERGESMGRNLSERELEKETQKDLFRIAN